MKRLIIFLFVLALCGIDYWLRPSIANTCQTSRYYSGCGYYSSSDYGSGYF